MEINQKSTLDEISQALEGCWEISSDTNSGDTWNVIELGQVKIYEATLKSGSHIIPFKNNKTRVLEIYTNDGALSQILKIGQTAFNLTSTSICRILFY